MPTVNCSVVCKRIRAPYTVKHGPDWVHDHGADDGKLSFQSKALTARRLFAAAYKSPLMIQR